MLCWRRSRDGSPFESVAAVVVVMVAVSRSGGGSAMKVVRDLGFYRVKRVT